MGLIDFKHKLALFAQPLRTVITLSVAVVVFLLTLLSYTILIAYLGFAKWRKS
jgi:hypothetical protein